MPNIDLTTVLGAVTVFAIIVIPLITSYMERKQLRQLELYKENPQLHPLKPPPSALVRWIRKYWFYLFGLGNIGMDTVDLCYHVYLPDPPSHHDVFAISLDMTIIFAWLLFLVASWFLDKVFAVLKGK